MPSEEDKKTDSANNLKEDEYIPKTKDTEKTKIDLKTNNLDKKKEMSAFEKLKELKKIKLDFEEPMFKIKETNDFIKNEDNDLKNINSNKKENSLENDNIKRKEVEDYFQQKNKQNTKTQTENNNLNEKINNSFKKENFNKEETIDYFEKKRIENEEKELEKYINKNKQIERKYFGGLFKHQNKNQLPKKIDFEHKSKPVKEKLLENGKTDLPEKDISKLNINWEKKDKEHHLNWLKKEIIPKPNREDFSNYQFKEHPEWIKDTDPTRRKIQKEYVHKPKWIINKKEEEADDPNEVKKIKIDNAEEIPKKLETVIDKLFKLLENGKAIDSGKISKELGLEYYVFDKIIKIFEEEKILNIKYPASLAKPQIKLINPIKDTINKVSKGTILEEYELVVDCVPARVTIIKTNEEPRPIYSIEIPCIGKYTRRFLDLIKEEVVEDIPIDLDEILDPKKSKGLKKKFFEESKKKLLTYFKNSSQDLLNIMSGLILHEIYGLGNIELILGDDMLEEVAINSAKTPITIYHRIHGWMKTNLNLKSEDEIMNFASQIGRKVGREITILNPILDAHLLSGDRVNATLFPISAGGNTLTIRRFARRPWTITDFIGKAHTMNAEMAATLWLAMQYELNVLIAGGTASGKTSALNTLLALIPSYHRTISIEDVREITLPKYLNWNWIPMVTRSANPEGLGEVTMLDCMISSLRMRPDRIIVGEMRRKKEAEVMMEAIETGHSIYSTLHANSAYQVLRRLGEAPMSIPLMQIEQLDLIVVQYRDRKTNKRRTLEIAEIEQTSTGKGLQVNSIYKWAPRTDTWEQLNRPTKLLTLLNLHTGLTEEEIHKDLEKRKKILNWMKDKEIIDLDVIGYLMKIYYTDPEEVLKMAENEISYEEVKERMQ